jgi:hypothetical protein
MPILCLVGMGMTTCLAPELAFFAGALGDGTSGYPLGDGEREGSGTRGGPLASLVAEKT